MERQPADRASREQQETAFTLKTNSLDPVPQLEAVARRPCEPVEGPDLVRAAEGDERAIGRKGEVGDLRQARPAAPEEPPRGRLPELEGPIAAPGDERAAVGE